MKFQAGDRSRKKTIEKAPPIEDDRGSHNEPEGESKNASKTFVKHGYKGDPQKEGGKKRRPLLIELASRDELAWRDEPAWRDELASPSLYTPRHFVRHPVLRL